MYTGPTDELVPWFTSLGYYYDLQEHGMASDWALDLVALGFTKPQQEQQQDDDAAAADVVEAPAGVLEQQQGSIRYRGVGLAPELTSTMAREGQLQRQPSMMSSKLELVDAADSFLEKLQQEHSEWFIGGYGMSAASAGPTGASSSSANAATALVMNGGDSAAGHTASPRSWWQGNEPPRGRGQHDQQQPHTGAHWWRKEAASDAEDDAAADQDVEQQQQKIEQQPQKKLEAAIAQVETAVEVDEGPFAQRKNQQSLLVLEQQIESFWGKCVGALHKYRALLWRELLITTRSGSKAPAARSMQDMSGCDAQQYQAWFCGTYVSPVLA